MFLENNTFSTLDILLYDQLGCNYVLIIIYIRIISEMSKDIINNDLWILENTIDAIIVRSSRRKENRTVC